MVRALAPPSTVRMAVSRNSLGLRHRGYPRWALFLDSAERASRATCGGFGLARRGNSDFDASLVSSPRVAECTPAPAAGREAVE